jgi:hypothetical protein
MVARAEMTVRGKPVGRREFFEAQGREARQISARGMARAATGRERESARNAPKWATVSVEVWKETRR